MESVDVIASGYEFVCLKCEALVKIIEVKEIVFCRYCETEYEVKSVNNAIS